MREIRLSGSEGGGAKPIASPYPYLEERERERARFCSSERETPRRKAVACAPESTRRQRGASPLQEYALRPETECNCVAKRRGGEQQEVNDQSVR